MTTTRSWLNWARTSTLKSTSTVSWRSQSERSASSRKARRGCTRSSRRTGEPPGMCSVLVLPVAVCPRVSRKAVHVFPGLRRFLACFLFTVFEFGKSAGRKPNPSRWSCFSLGSFFRALRVSQKDRSQRPSKQSSPVYIFYMNFHEDMGIISSR